MFRALGRAFLVACLSLSFACVAPPRAYTPRVDQVELLGGGPAAEGALRSAIQRATLPSVGTVEITPAYVRYQHTQLGPFEAPMGTTWTHLTWSRVDRVDLYPNHRAFVYEGGSERTWLQFGNADDAERFADLMMSFKAWSARGAN